MGPETNFFGGGGGGVGAGGWGEGEGGGNMSKRNSNNATAVLPQRRKSLSTPLSFSVAPKSATGKLHKPPQVPALHAANSNSNKDTRAPRNRLKKRAQTLPIFPSESAPTSYFILEHDPYPSRSSPSEFLGVYSTIDAVTAAAFRHGAYTFSREGLLDGSEYLSPTGRIKISSHVVQRTGVEANIPERATTVTGEVLRLDIPHPFQSSRATKTTSQITDSGLRDGINTPGNTGSTSDQDGDTRKDKVFLAVHEGPRAAFCIGAYVSKSLAWGACLKDKAWLAWSDTLVDEERTIEEDNMPRTSAKIVGSGRVSWFVKGYEVDCTKIVKLRGGHAKLLTAAPEVEDGVQQTAVFDVSPPPPMTRGQMELPPGCRDV